MNIGIDVDGVITDMSLWFKAYKETVISFANRTISDDALESYFFKAGLGRNTLKYLLPKVSLSEYRDRLSTNLYHYYTCSEVREGFGDLTQELRARGHKVCIVTARSEDSSEAYYVRHKLKQTFRDYTYNYLRANGIEFDEYYFGAGNKAIVVRESGIDVMIDDYEVYLSSIASVVPDCRVIKYVHEYNGFDSEREKYEAVRSVSELRNKLCM